MEEREEKFAPITLPLSVKFDKWTATFIINNANGEYAGRAVERGLARKFAAAPEMCEALKELMDAMDDVLYNADRVPDCTVAVVQEAMDKAKTALKKARGEA